MRTLVIIVGVLLSVIAVMLFASTSSLDVESDLRAGIARCADCHGKVGHSVAPHIPNLAGQNAEYLINQLQRFANLPRSDFVEGAVQPSLVPEADGSRRRKSQLMEQHTEGLSGGVLRNVALYYSKLPCVQADKPKASNPMPTGIPWCADCHAPQKAQSIPSIPYINGQNAEYLEAQLLAFKRSSSTLADGVSDTRSHHFMELTLRDISDERLREVAQYLSQQSCAPRLPSGTSFGR